MTWLAGPRRPLRIPGGDPSHSRTRQRSARRRAAALGALLLAASGCKSTTTVVVLGGDGAAMDTDGATSTGRGDPEPTRDAESEAARPEALDAGLDASPPAPEDAGGVDGSVLDAGADGPLPASDSGSMLDAGADAAPAPVEASVMDASVAEASMLDAAEGGAVLTEAGAGPDATPDAQPDAAPEPDPDPPENAPADCTEFHELRAHAEEIDGEWAPYVVPPTATGDDSSRVCFYFDAPFTGERQALWFEGLLDDPGYLHHWALHTVQGLENPPADTQPCSALETIRIPIAGGTGVQAASALPDDVGLALDSKVERGLVLELHYANTSAAPIEDRSGVRFCTAPVDTRPHTAAVHVLGSEGICIEPDKLQSVTGDCWPRTDMGAIQILGSWPRLGAFGTSVKSTVYREAGGTEVFYDSQASPDDVGFVDSPFTIFVGDALSTQCLFDNRDRDSAIHFGFGPDDGACYLFVLAYEAGALSNNPSVYANPINSIGSFLPPRRRCMDPVSIFGSCNGLLDYPTSF